MRGQLSNAVSVNPPHPSRSSKPHALNLEPEDLVALTVESAAMDSVPLVGTEWIPGRRLC